MKKINILGTDYSLEYLPDETIAKDMQGQPGEYGGYCDGILKRICISKCDMLVPQDKELINTLQKESLRHEIVHAFLNESGLKANADWSQNEEMVDWIALQFPKMLKAYEKLGCL